MYPLHGCKLALSLPLRPNDSTAFAASDRPQFGGIRPPCLGPAAVSCDCQSQFAVRSVFMWRARHISLASASRWLSFAHPGSVTALQKWVGVMRTFKRHAVCGSRSRTRWDRLALLGFGAMTASSMGQTVLHVDLFAGKSGDGSLRRAGGFLQRLDRLGRRCGHRTPSLPSIVQRSFDFQRMAFAGSIAFMRHDWRLRLELLSPHDGVGPGGCLHASMQAIFLRAQIHVT